MASAETRAVLRQLVSAWSERWHALTEAAGQVRDPTDRERLLAMAEAIETCDMEARRAAH
jgi:hypothetical protein